MALVTQISFHAFTVLILLSLPASLSAATAVGFRSAGLRLSAPVVSFHEIRQSKLVRQGWDKSCGAAALSTILQYHYGHRVSEAAIAVTILKNVDPHRVRARGGFSLLDLKRFVRALGYEGKGYGGLTLQDLVKIKMPAIIPVRFRDFDHFVVFRGFAGNRVLLGDPAFGNLTMTSTRFHKIWKNGIGFIVAKTNTLPPGLSPLSPDELDMMVPNLKSVTRSVLRRGVIPVMRHPPAALR